MRPPRPPPAQPLCAAIDHPVSRLIIVHNGDSRAVADAVARLQSERPEIELHRFPENKGCAASWNFIVEQPAPWWLLVNDDVAFPPGALARLAETVWGRLAAPGTVPAVFHPRYSYNKLDWGWGCFAITREAVAAAGTFDENFYPVYHEDRDYEWRLRLLGLNQELLSEVSVIHGKAHEPMYISGARRSDSDVLTGGCAGTMRALADSTNPAHQRIGRQLRRSKLAGVPGAPGDLYYRQKWGALPPFKWTPSGGELGKLEYFRNPFNQSRVSPSEWVFDLRRRDCILTGRDAEPDGLCPYDLELVRAPDLSQSVKSDL